MAELTGRLVLAPEGLTADVDGGEALPWKLHGTMGWTEDMPASADLDVESLPLSLPSGLTEPIRVWVTGKFHLEGPLARPRELVVTGTLEGAHVRIGSRELETLAPATLEAKGGRVLLGPLRLSGGGSTLEGSVAYRLEDESFEGDARGELDLGILSALFPSLNASGPIKVELRAKGTLDAPQVEGTFEVQGGRARLPGVEETLEQIDLLVRVDHERVTIERLRAILGGGELTGAGSATLRGLAVASYQVDLRVDGAALTYPEGFRAVYEGSLSLAGTAEEGKISGQLRLLRGLYGVNFDLGALLRSQTRAQLAVEESPLPKNISLDVDIDADGNVWIRNDDARIEGAVDLHLGGPLARAELTGRIRLFEGGTLRFRDVEYELTAGTVDFVDRRKVDPIIDLRAQTRVQEYEVFLHVEGTAEKFNYELTSDPPLSTQDIIALLLTGTTLESLTTAEGGSGFSGDLAANYFAGALTERLSKQLRQSLGLERLQINPLLVQGQADPTARVTVGKRVGEKVRVIYSVDLGSSERQIYQVEWQATRGFRLVAERDTTGGIGGDLRYAKRFGASHPAPRVAEPGESAEPAPAPQAVLRVAGLRVEGVPDDEAKRLLEMIAIRPGDPFRRVRMFEAGEAVRRRFVRAGRIEAKVRSEEVPEAGDADAVRLVFTVEQGPLVTVHLDGVDGRMRRRLGKRLEELWVESVFSQDLYDEGSQVVLRDLRSRGYYAADVDHEVLPEEGAKTVRYRIDPGSPVRVRKIFIEGNKAVGEDEIRLQMSTRPDSIFTRRLLIPSDLAADVRAISRLYQDRGMVEAKIDPPEVGLASDGKEAEVTVRIHEGPVYRVSEVEFPKDLPPDLDLTSPIGIAPGDVFSPTKLLEAESVVRTRLDAAGYPEARVEAVPGMSGGGVHVAFAIDADGRKRVGAIEIVGLTRTKEKIVRRELELQEGDWISRDKILMTQHRLYRLGIFRSVRIDYAPITGTDPSSQTLRIRLEEGPPYGVTVGGGYDTEAGPRATFSISDDNIGGRDRDLALQGRFSGIERRVQILAKEPRLFGRSIDAIATFFVEHQEEVGFTVDRRATALRLEKKIDPRWTRYIRYNFQRVDLTDVVDVAELFDQKLTNLRLGDVGIAVVRDSRDDPFLATRGGIASAEVRLFAKPFVSDSSFWKVFLQGSAIHTFPSGTAVAGALRLGASQPFGSTEAVPLSERFFAGGQATLRGFARDSVGPTVDGQPTGGEASLLLSEEFRYPIWGRLKGSIFIDAGNVYETLQKFDPTDLRETAGVGLRFETPIGPLRVEYGRKLDRRAGESEGEFFLAIGSAF